MNLPSDEFRVARAIAECRTPALGGHVMHCDSCGHTEERYNSCRNRHCPICQGTRREEWVQERQTELLPVPYFHAVFTLPDMLYPLIYANKRALFNALFRAASGALIKLTRDPQQFGGTPGFIAVLHTWNQKLGFHPHLHCIVAGGALTDDGALRSSTANFFLPVRPLARIFRGKFIAFTNALPPPSPFLHDDLSSSTAFEKLLTKACHHDWNVYVKPPFGPAEDVLKNIGRYTIAWPYPTAGLFFLTART